MSRLNSVDILAKIEQLASDTSGAEQADIDVWVRELEARGGWSKELDSLAAKFPGVVVLSEVSQ
jgi:hypothetical protein